ncbi:MAG: hypothetical protein K2K79_02185, partial [Paramuribaculum sp.]|nr:hypothetical protein [Paramuribaculum sp.]
LSWLERRIVVPKVVGSTPTVHPIKSLILVSQAFCFSIRQFQNRIPSKVLSSPLGANDLLQGITFEYRFE